MIKLVYAFLIPAFTSLIASGQSVNLSNVVHISLPQNAARLTLEQVKQYEKAHFKYSATPKDIEGAHFYRLNNVLLCFWDLPQTENSKSLEQQRNESLNMLSGDFNKKKRWVVMAAKIETVNNIKVLVLKDKIIRENTVYLWLYTDYHNQNNFNGLIQYNIDDDKTAEKILDNLLKSISFK